MVLNPADEKCVERSLRSGTRSHSAKKVVAVQLDQGIEIDDDHGNPGEENELVAEVVNPFTRLGIDPNDSRLNHKGSFQSIFRR